MKFAVTGATGFVGAHLLDRLLENGHEVVAMVRSPESEPPLTRRGVRVVIGEIGKREKVDELIRGADVVVNLARAKAHGLRPLSEVTAVNVIGAANVARAASESGAKLIHASSSSVYGSRTGPTPVMESRPPAPDTAYARSKLEGEREVMREHRDTTALRISAILGPRCSSWLPLFRSASKGELRLAGDGDNLQHPVDVDDVVSAILACAASDNVRGATYNIAGPAPISISEMVECMSRSVGGIARQPRPVPTVLSDTYVALAKAADKLAGIKLPRIESVFFLTSNRAFDVSKAGREIPFFPRIDATTALKRTGEYFLREKML